MDPPPPYPGKNDNVNHSVGPENTGGYQQQPYNYQYSTAGYMQPNVVSPGNVIVVQLVFGLAPVAMHCPYCQADIITATRRIMNIRPFIYFFLLFVLGFFFLIPWFCSFIPFCGDDCDVEHRCPNCNRVLGRYQR